MIRPVHYGVRRLLWSLRARLLPRFTNWYGVL